MSPDCSLAPIDVGFDPRTQGMRCEISERAKCIRYQVKDSHELRDAVGTIEEIATELRANGYLIEVKYG